MELNFYKVQIDELELIICEYLFHLLFINTSITISKAMVADHTKQIKGDFIDMNKKAEYFSINFEKIKIIKLIEKMTLNAHKQWDKRALEEFDYKVEN